VKGAEDEIDTEREKARPYFSCGGIQ